MGEDTKTNQSNQSQDDSSKNSQLLNKSGLTIAEIAEQANGDKDPAAAKDGSKKDPQDKTNNEDNTKEQKTASGRKVANTDGMSHGFGNADERRSFMKELIASKQYFVNIKQRKYHKGITFSLGLPTKTKNDTTPNKTTEKTPAKVSDQELAAQAEKRSKNKKLTIVIVTIWTLLFLGLDTGLLNIGIDLPFSIFGNDVPEATGETVDFELITDDNQPQ